MSGRKKRADEPVAEPAEPIVSSPIDISDENRFVVTDTVSERELRDAYLEWCMRRHGSQTIVSALTGVSTKSIYNRMRERGLLAIRGTGHGNPIR